MNPLIPYPLGPETRVSEIIPGGVDTLLRRVNKLIEDSICLYECFESNQFLFRRIKNFSIDGLIGFLESFKIPEELCNFQHELPHDFLE